MVVDKFHARSLGPINHLVRQPTEGRARHGGLRIGEMERDCLIAHGATALMSERLLWKSDAYRLLLCRHCGRGTCHNGATCDQCEVVIASSPSGTAADETSTPASPIVVPYSFKLLLQEMTAMGIDWRVELRPSVAALAPTSGKKKKPPMSSAALAPSSSSRRAFFLTDAPLGDEEAVGGREDDGMEEDADA